MALKIIDTLLKHTTKVDSERRTDMLFDFIAPLVNDDEDIDEEVWQTLLRTVNNA